MKLSLLWIAALVLLAAPACRFLVSVPDGTILVSGFVEERDGTPVWKAKVWVDSTATTFTDRSGQFRLRVPARVGSFTVMARNGYTPGMVYAVTCAGSRQVTGRHERETLIIVLDGCGPI